MSTRRIQDVYPLSPLQEGMLFHSLYAPESGVYVEQLSCELLGPLDVAAFECAWGRVIERHAILRTAFVWKSQAKPLQAVQREVALPLERLDWSGLDAGEREERLGAFLAADRRRGFELAKAPLLRLALVRVGEEAHLFVWTIHHLLVDGWSLPLLLHELFACYAAFQRGAEPALAPVRPFADYLAWLQRQDPAAAEAFFRRELAGFVVPTPIGADRLAASPETPTAVPESEHAVLRSYLDAATTAGLERAAQARHLTLNVLVEGAWAAALARHGAVDEVVFGVTMSGRSGDLPGIESMVGLFINTLPLRLRCDPEAPLAAWLGALQDRQLELQRHEHAPLAGVRAASDVQRGLPLFESLYVFENYPAGARSGEVGGGLRLGEMRFAERNNYPLTAVAAPGEELALELEYDRGRFEPATAARLLVHFRNLVAAMAAADPVAPAVRLGDLAMLSAAERQQLLNEWNDTAAELPAAPSVHALVEDQAALRPQALAVAAAGRRLTYGALDRAARRLAARLTALGAGPERVVAVLADRSAEAVVAGLAAWKAGAAYLPLDPASPPERLAWLLADSGATALLVVPALRPLLPVLPVLPAPEPGPHAAPGSCPVLDLDAAIFDEGEPETAPPPKRSRQPAGARRAYLIYTSGSTGTPKGVEVDHASLLNEITWLHRLYALGARDRTAQIAGPAFDAAVGEIWPALAAGASLHIPDEATRASPAALVRWLAAERITFCFLPTPLAELACDEEWPEDTALRLMLTGGDTLHRPPRPGLPFRLVNHYGPTENTIDASYTEVAPGEAAPPPIGRPSGNVRLYLVDRRGDPVPIGVAGELWVGGAGVARGYLGRPELTAERFTPDAWAGAGARLYRTGDLARYRGDGQVEFLGRIDGQVKVRGFRIELGEIAAALGGHPGVRQAAAVAVPDRAGGERRLVAFYVPAGEADAAPAAAALREHLAAKLPAYMVPSRFVAVEALPLTVNGKVDRRALEARAASLDSSMYEPVDERAYTPPRTPAEEILCRVWAEVLRRERVGIDDNFFALGGDSILSIQVVARAGRAGCRITPRQLFENPTIAELAALAGSSSTTGAAPVDAALGPAIGPVPLTPIQRWFFATDPTDRHHFNQAVLLALRRPLAPAVAERAWEALVAHHDALRLRFAPDPSAPEGVRQIAAPAGDGRRSWARIDLSALVPAMARQALAGAASAVQASLDLARGPLARATWLDLPGEARLLLTVHHLAVDGVSWRVLLEDLQSACRRLAAGERLELPAKTTSFKRWAERLAEHARTLPEEAVAAEVAWWVERARRPRAALPARLDAAAPGPLAVVTVALDVETTRALLQEVPAAYRTRIDDALLAALAQALAGPGEALWVDLEGHGREELFPGVDLTRTVGWFTSVYPVALEAAPDPGAALRAVKEQLRAVPARGVGYGLLRYVRGEPRLEEIPPARIVFNYLGQLDAAIEGDSPFALAAEPAGEMESPRRRHRQALAVNAMVLGGRLRASFGYHVGVLDGAVVERLADDFRLRLEAIVAHCLAAIAAGRTGGTPSDFPLAGFGAGDQAALDRALAALPPGGIDDLYPLSPLQEGFLFHDLYAPGSGVYVEQLAVTVAGALDPPTVAEAWRRVVERTPILRTSIHWTDLPRPLQAVHRRVGVELATEDWSGLGGEEQARRWRRRLAEDRERGFDLGRPPLMRWLLVRMGEREHRFLWSHHHVLLDGWSYSGLVADFLAAYEALREGRAPRLPARRPYRDYIAWLANLGAAAAARAEAYWRAALAGWSEPTPIPADRRPGAHAAGAATAGIGSVELPLTVAETVRLQEGARRRQLTLSTLTQAAWGLLLARYGAPEDVVFGVTVSGRPAELPGVEGILGLFINSLPVRLSIAAAAPLGPWLAGLHRRAAELRQHEHTPLVRIQGWSEVPGGLPLFESLLVFENYPRDAALARAGSSLGIAAVESIEQTSYPLTVVALPAESLRLRIDYDRARFDGATARRLVGHLRTLLLAVGQAADDLPLGDLPLLSAAERQQGREWNATAAAFPPLGLADLFAAQAARSPEAPALAADGREVSYRELERRAARLARQLAALGIGPETPVAICLPRGPEMVVASLAVLLSGGAYVPLDPAYPPERLAWIAGDVAAPVVLVTAGAERAGFAWAGAARLVEVGAEGRSESTGDAAAATGAADTGADLPGRGIDDRRLAYVMYTSGSTGRPKGVAVTQRAVHRLVRHTDYVRLGPGDRVAQVANPAFDAATFEIWGALLNGGCLVFLPRSVLLSPPDLARALAEERVSTMFLTSALFHQVARQTPRAFAPLRELLFGGEAADPRLVRAVLAAGPPARLLHVYGPTETTTFATWHAVREVAPGAASVPIGGPVGNAVARVLDRELRELPVGAVGELCIGGWTGGEGLARGYLGRPELTAERFVPDPCADAADGGLGARLYRTGDLVRRLADGTIDFLGRLDRQVKLRGFRIEPGEIEAALAEHPRVRQAAVAVRQVGEGDRRLVAYVAADPAPGAVPDAEAGDAEAGSPGVIDPGELRAFLETRLPPYMVPAGFVFLGSLPLTATGKVDRRALAAGPAQEWGSRAGRVHVPPRTAAEAALAPIWAEVLRLDAAAGPSVEDDFFALGGDSILSIQIVARARQAGLAITPKQLFENPTIAGLAAVAASVDARAAESAADGEESAAAGPVPLTPVQRWFFAQELARPHHFDQAVLLALPEVPERSEALTPPIVAVALAALAAHHGSFALRFARRGGAWVQESAGDDVSADAAARFPLARIDLSGLAASAEGALAAAATSVQASLDLARGPLARAAWLDLPVGRRRLLLAVHHLAVDGVSWRVLLEDLDAACRRLMAGLRPALPPRTASFRRFAERLAERARDLAPETIAADLAWWRRQAERTPARLPLDRPERGADAGMDGREDTVAASRAVSVALDAEETAALLREVPAAYRTRIDDVLLAALAAALGGGAPLPVDLEGHGRDAVPGLDLSRTVGWFTRIAPVWLAADPAAGPGATLKAVKEQLRDGE
jgi:amino acid adenylation domain-containing protein/non-ribosomal peptide synthase protein (TIGR01720 family)